MTLSITMLPAGRGDCLWITYGEGEESRHIVVDGGPERDQALRKYIEWLLRDEVDNLNIEMIVVTHIDDDHIGGVLDLMQNWPAGLTVGDIWFNGRPQLFPSDALGVDQGERLSTTLAALAGRSGKTGWNLAFAGGPAVAPDRGPLRPLRLGGGLAVTVLGPGPAELEKLRREWSADLCKEDEETGKQPEDALGREDPWPPEIDDLASTSFSPDRGTANGSSIALLLEWGPATVLLAGDAHATKLAAAIRRVPRFEGRLSLNAFKLSHHGSAKSTSLELLGCVRCTRYLISTDGSYFGHPDPAALARVICRSEGKPEFIFNSRTPNSLRWGDPELQEKHGYVTRYPEEDGKPLVLTLVDPALRDRLVAGT